MLKVNIAQFFGYLLDSYDFTIITILSPFFAKLFLPLGFSFISILLSYGFTVIFRPLGSITLGILGDKIGRRDSLVISMLGISASIILTPFIPPYDKIGILSLVFFILVRIMVGIFTGGEYSNGYTFVEEWSSKQNKGISGAFVQSGFGIGSVLATLLIILAETYFGKNFFIYGWKYLFLLGSLIAIIAFWIRLDTQETPEFKEARKDKYPFKDSIKQGRKIGVLLFWFAGMMALALSFFQFTPVLLEESYGKLGEIIYAIAMIFTFPSVILFGKYYTTKLISYWGILVAILAIPLFYLLHFNNFLLDLVVSSVIGITTQAIWGSVPSLVTSAFSTIIRSTSTGLTVSLGMALGLWYTFAVSLTGDIWISSGIYLAVGGLLVFLSSKKFYILNS
ncbi:MFS transporter [Acidianus manzaensis]|uniref:Major facilitator superfamily (MFS) profile domain-containing protein n=1 Tax=Acidianus manzaensis TaxID=282676 RepID=A0A1W6K2R7_9CREN|nr:MFS transporter [Acidianus manzaensis]ARM76777.1 hypothetical protein B6F84_12630 [Acidianus manzaensis]